jgi:hypothetical protein
MKRLLLAASMFTALALPAQADVVLGGQNWVGDGTPLTLSAVVPGGNQPLNIQCVICGDNQPQQSATFGYTDFKNNGGISSITMFSTNVSGGGNPGNNTIGLPYDGTFLRNYLISVGDPTLSFSIGIDLNDNNTPQTLDAFYLLNFTTGKVLEAFTTPTALPNQNNGTGFPDYTLTGFDITVGTDVHLGDKLIFVAKMSNMSDGPDSFFLVPAAVPGPIAGAGIPGLIAACGGLFGFNRFRRKRLGMA